MAKYLIGTATLYAIEKHAGQQYGHAPYHVHLFDAVHVLRRFFDWDSLPQEIVDAVWLHDTIEDTSATKEEIEEKFGNRVAELVFAVTNEKGENRKERHAKTYPKIRCTEDAITVKLADRIANIEQSISHDRYGRPPQKIFSMYVREWESFKAELRDRCDGEGPVNALMWAYLDELMKEGNEKLERFKNMKGFRGGI